MKWAKTKKNDCAESQECPKHNQDIEKIKEGRSKNPIGRKMSILSKTFLHTNI